MIRALRASPLAYFAVAYGAAAALQKGLGFVLFLWLAHSLSVRDYATFGLLYALQMGLAALLGAGIVESVIGLMRERSSFHLRGGVLDAANRVFALLAVPSITIVAAIYVLFMRDAGTPHYVLALVIVAGVLTAFFTLQSSIIRLDEQHGASLALSFFSPLGGLAGGAVGFALGANVASFFAGSAIGLVVTSFLLAGLRLGFYGFAAKRADMTGILSRILPFIFIAALGWLGGYGNTYLVESFFTASDVAKFTFAYTLSSVLQLVATSLNQVWSPRFYRMAHTQPPQEVEPANRRFFAFQGAAIGLAGGCILVLLPGAIDHVGGNLVAYRRINLELLILFAAYAVSIPAWQSQNYFYAFNKGKDLMHVTLVGSVAGLILWVLAALTLGTIGAYVGFMMQMLTRSVTAIIRARREWGIRVAWEGPALAMLLLIAGAAASAAIYR